MKEIELEPIPETIEDYELIEKKIKQFFFDEIYKPLLELLDLPDKTIKNSSEGLLNAIRSGRIWFYRGQFLGRFSSSISKELRRLGATWDRKQGCFRIPLSKLPSDIKQSIGLSISKFNQTVRRIDQKLNDIVPEEMAEHLRLESLFDRTIYKTDKKIQSSINNIVVSPKLTEHERAKIAKEYTDNMKLYIKDFTKEEIVKLRENMQRKVLSGGRYEDMIKTIRRSYNVSEGKAKFLARQETSILMAKFKKARYTDIGSKKYKWRCVVGSSKHPVRPMHKLHNNKIFLWDSPPVVNTKGERKNPGEDYGCRCTAIPIINFKET